MSTAPPLFALPGPLLAACTDPASAELTPGVARPRAVHSARMVASSLGKESRGQLYVLAAAGGAYRLEAR